MRISHCWSKEDVGLEEVEPSGRKVFINNKFINQCPATQHPANLHLSQT